jgi:GH24 family phage-related lysozyme (muramidase)
MSLLDRWNARLGVRRALEKVAEGRVAFWRARKAKAVEGTPAFSHAGAMLARREAELAKRRAQVAFAERVIARHTRATRVSMAGVSFIKRFEGFSPTIYDDGRGVLTVGYGHTEDVHAGAIWISGQHVGGRLTEPEAATLLRDDLNLSYAPPVAAVPLRFTQNEFDALVSFAFNLGIGAVQGQHGFETMTRAIHAGDKHAIADAMLLYDNPNDPKVHEGLRRRRHEERAMFLNGH